MKASGGSSDDRVNYTPSKPGEFVAGKLAGIATLASGHFAMIDDGLGFQFVPWQPVLDKRIGQHQRCDARQRRHRVELRTQTRWACEAAEKPCVLGASGPDQRRLFKAAAVAPPLRG
ncbi:hypothetical protein CQ10_35965 [Bradyrhizobium valentinum]|uniref:DUF3363 domain-containing protein n=1 Tax=Bradyrhizobium valentinum TaxID=1518501 RepID=A0A0R3KCI3_9BRAD|nr:hypothetical protein CQ10_35965 [Bradyrhizobium valentinum]KRR09329.1 hypothetical protein CP49_21195 [Bradyrhizobium valentinum]